MTYHELINTIERAALESGVVNSFYYADVNVLNTQNNIKYPVVIMTAQSISFGSTRSDSASFTLVYADRLSSIDYKRKIHSTAISMLRDIINRAQGYDIYEEQYSVSYNTIVPYTQLVKAKDAVSGAYMNMTIEFDNEVGDCYFTDEDCNTIE